MLPHQSHIEFLYGFKSFLISVPEHIPLKFFILFRIEVDIECFDRFAEHRFVCSLLGCHKFGGECVENVVQVFSRVRQHQCFLPSIVCDVVANEYVIRQSRNPLCPAYPLAFRLTFKRPIWRERLGHGVARGNSGMQQTLRQCRHCSPDCLLRYVTSTAFRSSFHTCQPREKFWRDK